VRAARGIEGVFASSKIVKLNDSLIRALIDAGANCNQCALGSGETCLHSLAKQKDPKIADVIDALIAGGANVNAVDVNGATPFDEACVSRNIVAVMALVKGGCTITRDSALLSRMFSDRVGSGWNSMAVRDDALLRILSLLFEHGMTVNEGEGSLLCLHESEDVIKLLVTRGANVNHANSPLQHAVKRGDTSNCSVLLELGARASASHVIDAIMRHVSPYKLTSKMEKEEEENKLVTVAIVEMLLRTGTVDVNEVVNGSTALHACALSGVHAVCPILLAAGALVNAVDGQGLTPLEIACDRGSDDVCFDLLKANAALTMENVKSVAKRNPNLARTMLSVLHPKEELSPSVWGPVTWLVSHGFLDDVSQPMKFASSKISWKDEHLIELASAMKSPQCILESIELGYEDISDAAVMVLAEALPKCLSLKRLNLIGCREMTAVGCRAIIRALKDCPHIMKCDLVFANPSGYGMTRGGKNETWKFEIMKELKAIRPTEEVTATGIGDGAINEEDAEGVDEVDEELDEEMEDD
jgi:ankyrin repeat protein